MHINNLFSDISLKLRRNTLEIGTHDGNIYLPNQNDKIFLSFV